MSPLAMAQTAIAKKDWAAAELILIPLGQAQPNNPFVYYELAQVYENTNRVEAAKKIYQTITSMTEQRQYAVVVRSRELSYIASLMSLAQAKLNMIKAAELSVATVAAPSAITPVLSSSAPAQDAAALERDNASVDAALKGWVKAWTERDVAKYLAHYVAAYKGTFHSHALWQENRRQRILSKKDIKVTLSDLRFSRPNESHIVVNFKQAYTSDRYTDVVRKSMTFVRAVTPSASQSSASLWLIERESSEASQ